MSLFDIVLVLHCSTLYDHCSLFCFLLFSLFLGFALHKIHAFHSRLFCYLKKKTKEAKCVLHYFFGFEIKDGQFIFT